ncbi:hypothetical protein FJY63_13690, partial [Candidatus Sumerlaeota bacterium]|nr:hypothetical protein [Candidatus Sumerlaeota bacterium]
MASRSEKLSRRWLVVAAGLAILTLVSPLVVEPVAGRIRLTLAPDAERDKSSGIVRILRELQFSLSDICYAKSTLYQHRGVVYQIEEEDILAEEIGHEQQQGLRTEPGLTSPTVVSGAAEKHEGHEEAV